MSASETFQRPDIIRDGEAYRLDHLKQLGLGEFALRKMRKRGLKVRRVGRRSFVLGRDLLSYLDEHAKVVA